MWSAFDSRKERAPEQNRYSCIASEGQQKDHGLLAHRSMQKCFIGEQKDTFLASRISYLRPSSYMWTFQQTVFSLSANFSMTATPFIFQILSDSTVGVALHFWGVPSPLPPLLFLCCATLELPYQLLQAHHTSQNPQVSTDCLESLTV